MPVAFATPTVCIEIRRAFEAAIKGATLAGQRVYRSRIFPIALQNADGTLRTDVLPAILIYSGDEEIEQWGTAPLEYRRSSTVFVDITAQVREEFDDVIDFIRAEVEAVIEQDETLGDRCEQIPPPTMTRSEPIRDGAVTLGSVRLRFDVIYHTQVDDSIELPDLNQLCVEYDLAPPDTVIEATDIIDLSTP